MNQINWSWVCLWPDPKIPMCFWGVFGVFWGVWDWPLGKNSSNCVLNY